MRRSSNEACFGSHGHHNAQSRVLEIIDSTPDEAGVHHYLPADDYWPRTDARWPKKCDYCGYRFTADDVWQVCCDEIYFTK